jgi:ribosomal protein L14
MLQIESKLNVIDNSGVLKIKIISTYNKKNVKVGHLVLTCLRQKRAARSYLSKYLGLIVGMRTFTSRKSGMYFRCDSNNIILLKDNDNLLGSQFFGPILTESFQYKDLKEALANQLL